jgi:hypothetical protein
MANEKTATLSYTVSKNGQTIALSIANAVSDMTGNQMTATTQTIGFAAAEAIVLTELANCAELMIKNIDATNFVYVDGVNTMDSAMKQKLLPGEAIFLRPTGTTFYAQADTGAVDIALVAAEL